MSKYKIIGRGFNGWHAQSDSCSLSGAYADKDCDRLAKQAVNGALVYDAKNADSDAFTRFVLSGPMVKTSLPDGEEQPLTDMVRDAAQTMLPGMEGTFKGLAKAAQNKAYKGLDYVSVATYRRLLEEHVSGVRFGTVYDGKITWEA